MGPMMQTLMGSLGLSNFIMNLIASDVDDADSRRRARDTEGASLVWVMGHLINYRYILMNLLGADKSSPYADIFGNEATGGTDYPHLSEVLEAWNQAAKELEEVSASVTDEFLLASPGGDGPHGEKARIEMATFYAWHEAYHIGQMGTLRKEMGYPATADLAIAASKS